MQPETNKIINKILSELDEESLKVTFQIGHYSLISDSKGTLIPAIVEEIFDPKLIDFVSNNEYIGDFPTTSLNLGLEIIKKITTKYSTINIAFIVNDWQWLSKGVFSNSEKSSDYFKRNSLPQSYYKRLFQENISINQLLKFNNSILFSELNLRKLCKNDSLFISKTSCALEYLPFLDETLSKNSILVSIIPMTCKISILYASIKYLREITEKRKLIHVFYNPINKEKELSILTNDNLNTETEARIIELYFNLNKTCE